MEERDILNKTIEQCQKKRKELLKNVKDINNKIFEYEMRYYLASKTYKNIHLTNLKFQTQIEKKLRQRLVKRVE